MAPESTLRKRKDIGDGDTTPVGGSNASNADLADNEGQAQPPESLHATPTPEPQSQVLLERNPHAHQREGSAASPADDEQSSNDDGTIIHGPQAGNPLTPSNLDALSLEQLEGELRLELIRQAILKKRQGTTPTPQVPVANSFRARASSIRVFPTPMQAAHPHKHVDAAAADNESLLRERQKERLRRAGLLPPRASEVPFARATPAAYTGRPHSVPPTTTLLGIDKKIADIMESTNRGSPGPRSDKSELSRAGIKMAAPDKWNGDRSLQKFTDFTHAVAHYFKVHAPLTESLKVDLLGGYLSGDPLDWYWRYVAPTASQWTAANVMVALRRQFLIDELSRQAADDFESAKQGSLDIHAFQAQLLKLADQMAEYPSPVALNRRLLKGMKYNLSTAIVANRGIDAETSPWEEIVQAAMDQERALRYASSFKATPDAPAAEYKAADGKVKDSAERTPAAHLHKNNTASPPRVSAPMNKPSPYLNKSPMGLPTLQLVGAKPADQCRTCGAFGHWSSDCPKRLRAALLDIDPKDDYVQYIEDDESEVEAGVMMYDNHTSDRDLDSNNVPKDADA